MMVSIWCLDALLELSSLGLSSMIALWINKSSATYRLDNSNGEYNLMNIRHKTYSIELFPTPQNPISP